MLHENRHLREPENLCDAAYTLGVILHFYSTHFAILLTGLCIDLALLASRQCCAGIIKMIAAAAEELLPWPLEDEWEEQADCDPIRVPAGLVWIVGILMLNVALDLLWWAFVPSASPWQALTAALFVMPLLMVITEKLAVYWAVPYEYHRFGEEAARSASEREQSRG
jgi:hypothetical protein